MRTVALLLAAVVLPSAAQERPRVTRGTLAAIEKSTDQKFEKLFPDNPYLLLGMTRGVYLEGYGAVLSTEVNLVLSAGVTPFRARVPKEEIAQLRKQKLDRIPVLQATMRQALIAAALSLDTVPAEEQVVLAVSLFHHGWEDTSGVPQQILMQAQRKAIVQMKTGGADQGAMEAGIRVKVY